MVISVASAAVAFLIYALGVSGSGYDWINTLPDCWQGCLSSNNGCDSSRCICQASSSGSFLPDAVSCAHSNCQADEWNIEAFLIPLQAYCSAVGRDLPDGILSSAQCAATETSTAAAASTRSSQTTQGGYGQRSSSKGGDVLTSIVTTTITQTSTDSKGETLQIIVPVVMGPSTMSYGQPTTSTIGGGSSATRSASSSPSLTAAPASTTLPQSRTATSTTSSKKSATTSSSSSDDNNGSPFQNMQAGAARWRMSGFAVTVGIAMEVLMRL